MKRQLATNTGINYAKTGVVYALRLALLPVMLDALGPRLFGVYVLVGSITGASDLVQSGLGLSIAKYTAECEAKGDAEGLNRIVSSAMLVSLGIALLIVAGFAVFFLALFTTVFSIPPDLGRLAVTYALLTLPALLATSIGTLYMRLFEGTQRYDVLAVFDIAGSSASFVLIFAFLKSGYGLLWVAVANVIVAFILLIGAIVAARRLLPHIRPRLRYVDSAGVKRTASFSWSAIALKSLAFFSDKTNPWIIGAFLPVAALAPYSVASRLHEGGRMTAALAGSAMMPAASGLHAREEAGPLVSLHLRSIKYAAAISLPVILSGIVLAEPLIRYWVGPQYLMAVPLAQVYLAYLIFSLQLNPNMSLILGMDQQKRILKPMVVATIVNVAISVVLCLRYGSMGVIIGSALGGIMVCFAALRIVMDLLDEGVGRYLREAVLGSYGAAIPVYLALWGFALWSPPKSLVAVICYAAVAWALYMMAFYFFGLGPGERVDVRKGLRTVPGLGRVWPSD